MVLVYVLMFWCFFFVKQKTAYEMRISDWSSDVCSSDLIATACIPLSAQGTQLGLLYLSDDDDGFLSRIDIIEAVAEQLSMALSNMSLRESLRLQSIGDPLTGLFNLR